MSAIRVHWKLAPNYRGVDEPVVTVQAAARFYQLFPREARRLAAELIAAADAAGAVELGKPDNENFNIRTVLASISTPGGQYERIWLETDGQGTFLMLGEDRNGSVVLIDVSETERGARARFADILAAPPFNIPFDMVGAP